MFLESQTDKFLFWTDGSNNYLFLIGISQVFLEAVQEQIENPLIEARPERNIVHETKNIVKNNATRVTFFSIFKNMNNFCDDLMLSQSDKPVSIENLCKSETCFKGADRCEDCFANSILTSYNKAVFSWAQVSYGFQNMIPELSVPLNPNQFCWNNTLQYSTILAKLRKNLFDPFEEMFLAQFTLFQAPTFLWILVPIFNCVRLCTLDDSFQLRTSVILSSVGNLCQVYFPINHIIPLHLIRVNAQNLKPSLFIWQTHFDMHLQSSRTKNGIINQIFSVGDSNHKDIIETFYPVNTGQQLIDNKIVDSTTADCSSFFAKGVYLIKNNAMKLTVKTLFFLFSFSIRKQLPDSFFTLSHHLIQDFRSINYFRFHFKKATDLPGDECFASPWRTIQKQTLTVFKTHFSHDSRFELPGSKNSALNYLQLIFQTSNFEVVNFEFIIFHELKGIFF